MMARTTKYAKTKHAKDYTREAFDKVCEVLNMVHHVRCTDWDLHVPTMLSAYMTKCKKLKGQTPFRLVNGVEVVMPMEYIVPSLCITMITGMKDCEALE